MYFTTFESKRRVRSPLPAQPNFLVFGKIYTYNRTVIDPNSSGDELEWRQIVVETNSSGDELSGDEK